MFIKLTKSGKYRYAQLVESYRDDAGKTRQRTIATLGRVDEAGGQVDALLGALSRAKGHAPADPAAAPLVAFESALSLGDVWALTELWKEVGFDQLAGIFRRARYATPVEHAVRVMVFNRLCDPDSKLGVLRWLETVSLPEVDGAALTHQQLLRAMDALTDHEQDIERVVAGLLRPMVDQELSLVFYDMTTIGVTGATELAGDVRQYGLSKEGPIARQFMLGVVQTAEGLPIYHEVFDGNQAEGPTLIPALTRVLDRYPHIKRLVIVADRGLLSLDNLEELQAMRLPCGAALEFILAVPARRYGEFDGVLDAFDSTVTDPDRETVGEARWQDTRLVIAHDPQRAALQTQARREKITALEAQAARWSGKLDGQDLGVKHRGRKLSDGGVTARFYHAVKDAHLAAIIRVDLASELFTYTVNEQALRRTERLDGKLLLVTNVADLPAEEVVTRYKSLADIERGFRILKSEIEIAPVYHRLPQRIRAHAMICFMALILYRVMRHRLRAADSGLSPERALEQLRRIYQQRITVDDHPISGVTTITKEQTSVLHALNVKRPAAQQLSLL